MSRPLLKQFGDLTPSDLVTLMVVEGEVSDQMGDYIDHNDKDAPNLIIVSDRDGFINLEYEFTPDTQPEGAEGRAFDLFYGRSKPPGITGSIWIGSRSLLSFIPSSGSDAILGGQIDGFPSFEAYQNNSDGLRAIAQVPEANCTGLLGGADRSVLGWAGRGHRFT